MIISNIKRIICDFDGTIALVDVTDAILETFADKEWMEIERLWKEGEITALQCMQRQIPLIKCSWAELDDFLSTIPLRKGFSRFVEFCISNSIELTVVSDGLDYAIQKIFQIHHIRLPIIANHLCADGDGFYLEFPYKAVGCTSGVCKCNAGHAEKPFILIGDGKSDGCLAQHASFVFAKTEQYLQRLCREKNYPFLAYDTFDQIREYIKVN